MKKLLSLIVVLLLVSVVAGCTSEATNAELTPDMALEDIISKTYEESGLEFPAFMNAELTKENQTYMLGDDSFDFIEGLASEPMMSSQAHSFVVFTVEEGSDIEAIKTMIKENVDGRKWICVGVEPENIVVDSAGNLIVLIMDNESLALHNAFLEVIK